MKISKFEIENFKNIKYAFGENLPDFIVICGSNGSGKSSILEAIMTAKECAGTYGSNYFPSNPNAVSANSDHAIIKLEIDLSETELRDYNHALPAYHTPLEVPQVKVLVKLTPGGGFSYLPGHTEYTYSLFSTYASTKSFFDYFSAHRVPNKSQLQVWNPSYQVDDQMKKMLASGTDKYQMIKPYLASLKMKDLQNIQKAQKAKQLYNVDSLEEIRIFFDTFYSPMHFDDVYIDVSPFKFLVDTPLGKIDIDELSSGEKEVLNTFIHFHHLNQKGSVVLFDEPDAHLHPELQKKYLRVLKVLGKGNQFIITTHSPEIMIEAGEESLYTVIKYQNAPSENQFVRVSTNSQLHGALTDVMGASGFVSLNRKIVFIEGESTSTDVNFLEQIFPTSKYNLSFVPAGDSTMIKGVSEKVMYLLDSGTSFQKFYCIIDGDIESRHQKSNRKLFKLPVYHVENYLLDEKILFEVTKQFLGVKMPYKDEKEVEDDLKSICLSDAHMNPFTKAVLDSKVFLMTEKAKDLIFQNKFTELGHIKKVEFTTIKIEALAVIKTALSNNKWKDICKGRDLLKAYCGKSGLVYEHFRNVLISKIEQPPTSLQSIIDQIIQN